jgi:hypothetical protein
MRLAAALLVLAAACQPSSSGSGVPAEYRADIENICDAEARSGAREQDPGRRAYVVASWLGPVIKTQEARQFLGRLGGLSPADKPAALVAEARKVGLEHCATADAWR